MVRSKKLGFDESQLNIKISRNNLIIIVLLICIFVLLLLFKRKININIYIEKSLLVLTLFLVLLIITKNILYSLIGSMLLFLVLNLMVNNINYIENFNNENFNNEHFDNKEDKEDKEDKKDKEIEDIESFESLDIVSELDKIMTPESKQASQNIKELLTKANGGIKLSNEDTKESKPLNIDTSIFTNDKKPNALRDAQKETYELIDTVNTLKDTLLTLNPVLTEGKKLMNMFETIKL
jgi:hypothetical protein